MEPIWSLGLMSGTSLDGVDAAWLRTDGQKIEEAGGGMMIPYPPSLREKIRSILGQRNITEEIEEVERELTLFHAGVVKQVVKEIGSQHSLDLIGFPGQTIFHAPPETRQIGDGKLLAQEVGVDVIYDFRTADVAHGGQGAPLVPVFHQALVAEDKPVAIVNVGGVANITWIQKGQLPMAWDSGPGGALLDDWVLRKLGEPYDTDGQLAAQGIGDEECLQQWLMHPYFAKVGPKSLDRDDFAAFLKDIEGFSPSDGAATLVELTARTIIHALAHMPENPHKLYITGGGRRNRHLMQRLAVLAPCAVDTVEALKWDGDLLEAYAFAYLAARVKVGLPTSFPTTTGVAYPLSGGQYAPCF
ncbi:MAG: anhydro-N-acetylmuramic acid kinase [Alphaproteobacteria bacterium]|nr:anhydro-N-acetylmuramic acid kinase [Alphaproteobacteria bacterium]